MHIDMGASVGKNECCRERKADSSASRLDAQKARVAGASRNDSEVRGIVRGLSSGESHQQDELSPPKKDGM